MITQHDNIKATGNLTGEDIAMTLDAESLAHIMGVLVNLYEDTEAASLREIASNARDSHVEAGITRPIEITLPSPLASFLTVRDFGTGLDAEDFRNIYSKYGASTKRDSNDFVGMLGLGCKAPLAYTSQFTVVGVKNGIMTTVNVSRDEDDGGTMTVIDESPTEEPNGVTVTIPTKRYNGFAEKADSLFKYWTPGTVLVNGEEPAFVTGLKITDEIILCSDGYYEDDVIVMGDVPYPVGRTTHDLGTGYSFVAFLPIGSVTPVPSREGLKDNKLKKDALEAIGQILKDKIGDAVQNNINEIDDPIEAFHIATEYRRLVPGKITLTHKGLDIPTKFKIADDGSRFVTTHYNGSPISRSSRERSLDSGFFDNKYLFVYGYDRPSFTPTQKKKLLKYADDNNIGVDYFILHEDKNVIDSHWLDTSKFVPWNDINTIVLPRRITSNGGYGAKSIAGSYSAYVEGAWVEEVAGDDIDTTDLYYINPSYYENYNGMCRLLAKYRPASTIVPLSVNRLDKFQRNFPDALPVIDELKNIYEVEIAAQITDEHRQCSKANDNWRMRQNFKSVDLDNVDDPELVKFVKMAKDGTPSIIDEAGKFRSYLHSMKSSDLTANSESLKNPFDNYPLFDYNADKDHLTLYINAIFAARNSTPEAV